MTIEHKITKKKLITHPGKHPEYFGRPMPEVDGLKQKKSKYNIDKFLTTPTSDLPPGIICSICHGTTDHITQHLLRQGRKTLQLCDCCYKGKLKANNSERLAQQSSKYGEKPQPLFVRQMTPDTQAITFFCARASGDKAIAEKTFETIHEFVSKSRLKKNSSGKVLKP